MRNLQKQQYFTSKNSIITLTGLLQKEQMNNSYFSNVIEILNLLRPDVEITLQQRKDITLVQNSIIKLLFQFKQWEEISEQQRAIFGIGILMKKEGFYLLDSEIDKFRHIQMQRKQNQEIPTIPEVLQMVDNFNDENLLFPQHYTRDLTKEEFISLERPQFVIDLEKLEISKELLDNFEFKCNKQQQLAILVLLQHFYQSQVTTIERSLNVGCLIHGGGGVGKSFIILFMIQLFEQLRVKYYILCPTQVAVQNILKEFDDPDHIMTINQFFYEV